MVNTNVAGLEREALVTTNTPVHVGGLAREALVKISPPLNVGGVAREVLVKISPPLNVAGLVREMLRSLADAPPPISSALAVTEPTDVASLAAEGLTTVDLAATERADTAAFVSRELDGSSSFRPALAEWLRATTDLLPRGRAWTRDPASNLMKLMGVIAQERKTRHERALVLLDTESVPQFSAELLPDWEQALGLPDPCRPLPGTAAERHAAIIYTLFADHPPTVGNLEAWAKEAGWNVTIREQRFFVPGVSMAGDAIGEDDFIWVVTVLDQQQSFFIPGLNFAGDPLWTFPDLSTLECVLRRAAPAHTQVYFILP